MVGTNELLVNTLTCNAVYGVAIDLAVAIDDTIFTREKFVLSMDMERMGLLVRCPQFTTQVFVIHLEPELIGVAVSFLNL